MTDRMKEEHPTLSYLTNEERLKAYQTTIDGCTHLFTKGKLQTDKAKEILSFLIELGQKDPYFLAHFTSWAQSHESRDLKISTVFANSLSSADGRPFSYRSKYKKPNLRYVSAAALLSLDPKMVLRVRELGMLKFDVPKILNEGSHFSTAMKTAIKKYLKFREANLKILEGIKKAGLSRVYKNLYRLIHLKPSDEAARILRWQQKDRKIEFKKSPFDFTDLKPAQIAKKIQEDKLPVLGVLGALPKITPAIAVALLEQASGNQALILRKTFEDAGVLEDEEVKELYKDKISEAKTSIDRVANLSKGASEEVKKIMKQTKSKVRKKEMKGLGKIFLHLDFCLHPNTEILSADGTLKRISELNPSEVATLDLESRKLKKEKPVKLGKITAPSELITVTTQENKITCSPEHRFFTLDNLEIKEIKAENIQKGQYLATAKDENFFKTSDPKKKINQLIGYLLGDGHAEYLEKRHSHRVIAYDKDIGNLRFYQSIAKNLGFNALIRHWGGKNQLCLNDVKLFKLIEREYPSLLLKSRERFIPEKISRLDKENIALFLRGLFDAEGTVNDHQVSFSTSSERMAIQTQLLLKRLGIVASFLKFFQKRRQIEKSWIKGGWHYRVIIGAQFLNEFKKEIDFASKQKRKSLKKIIHPVWRSRLDGFPIKLREIEKIFWQLGSKKSLGGQKFLVSKDRMKKIICLLEKKLKILKKRSFREVDVIRKTRKLWGISRKELCGNSLSEKKIFNFETYDIGGFDRKRCLKTVLKEAIFQRIKKGEKLLRDLKLLIEEDIIWSRVRETKKEKKDVSFLYDLTIPNTRTYIANGFIVHNSSSMHQIIEFAKERGAIIAETVDNPKENFRWGQFNERGLELPLPEDFTEDAFKASLFGRVTSGTTDVFACYPKARTWGAEVDCIVTDQGHNMGNLEQKIRRYHEKNSNIKKPRACVIISIPYEKRGLVQQAYEANKIPVAVMKPEVLRSSALVVQSVKTAIQGPMATIEAIMNTPLLELPEYYFSL